jgi:hypothetical protein
MIFGSRLLIDLHDTIMDILASQTARMSVHSMHSITTPTTLTLEVQGSHA